MLARCMVRAPRLAAKALKPSEYGYEARSLLSPYRLYNLHAYHKDKAYHVLHAHFGPVASSFRFARDLWRAPMVRSFHGYDFSSWPRKHGEGVYAGLFETADAITAGSSHALSRLEALGCPPEKLHKLSVGLDWNRFPYGLSCLRFR